MYLASHCITRTNSTRRIGAPTCSALCGGRNGSHFLAHVAGQTLPSEWTGALALGSRACGRIANPFTTRQYRILHWNCYNGNHVDPREYRCFLGGLGVSVLSPRRHYPAERGDCPTAKRRPTTGTPICSYNIHATHYYGGMDVVQ